MSTVYRCVSRHAEDLADGRVLAPGGIVEDLNLDEPHNKRLVEEGVLIVDETERLVEEAETETQPEPGQPKARSRGRQAKPPVDAEAAKNDDINGGE